MRWKSSLLVAAVVGCGVASLVAGCRREGGTHAATSAGQGGGASFRFESRTIGRPVEGSPWITDLTVADLDRDGWLDVIACEGRLDQVVWIRQTGERTYDEQTIGAPVAGPAHVEVADVEGDGDLDVLVASMGRVMPDNDRIGAVVVMENDGRQNFTNRVLLERTYRVTHVSAADLDRDGDLDLAVGQFGYLDGQVQWMENVGAWKFASHPLLSLAGCVHAPIADLNADGFPDIVALITQDWEEVHAFENQGGGRFDTRVLYGSTNKDYGGSGLVLADVDRDGDNDIVYTNGDAFDYATPGSRPWHGVQWLENDGRGGFAFRRVGDCPGAYSPVVTDLDRDGDHDIAVVSGFNDWSRPEAASLFWFENDGKQRFVRRELATAPTHLVVLKAADMDRDGRVELVTGGFHFYPPYDRMSRVTLWEQVR